MAHPNKVRFDIYISDNFFIIYLIFGELASATVDTVLEVIFSEEVRTSRLVVMILSRDVILSRDAILSRDLLISARDLTPFLIGVDPFLLDIIFRLISGV